MPLEKFLVFIIDDDVTMRSHLKEFINTRYPDATVDVFDTGEKALMNLHAKPDVILLDYHLENRPDGSLTGIDILKRIKQLLHSVPVIFISASDDPQISADIIKYGAFDFILKNQDALQRLEIMINNATGHLSLKKEIATQKLFNTILVALLVLIIILFVILQFT
ncbi:MAG: response regulator [Bacteroidota bacterium]|jgi:DNA-binding NtrC family response regulator